MELIVYLFSFISSRLQKERKKNNKHLKKFLDEKLSKERNQIVVHWTSNKLVNFLKKVTPSAFHKDLLILKEKKVDGIVFLTLNSDDLLETFEKNQDLARYLLIIIKYLSHRKSLEILVEETYFAEDDKDVWNWNTDKTVAFLKKILPSKFHKDLLVLKKEKIIGFFFLAVSYKELVNILKLNSDLARYLVEIADTLAACCS